MQTKFCSWVMGLDWNGFEVCAKIQTYVCSCAVSAQPGIETRLDQLKRQGCRNRVGQRKGVGLHAYGAQIPQRFSCFQQEIFQSVLLCKEKEEFLRGSAGLLRVQSASAKPCFLASMALAVSLLGLDFLPSLFRPPFFLFWGELSALRLPHYGFGECVVSTSSGSKLWRMKHTSSLTLP